MRFNLPPEVVQDLRDLSSDDLRREAFDWLKQLDAKPRLGRPLDIHVATGDLRGCRKIYFAEASHRIVYRLLPDEKKPQEVDVVSIGRKQGADLAIYLEAVKRLGR